MKSEDKYVLIIDAPSNSSYCVTTYSEYKVADSKGEYVKVIPPDSKGLAFWIHKSDCISI